MEFNLYIKLSLTLLTLPLLFFANLFFERYIRSKTPEEKLDQKKETLIIKAFRIISIIIAIIFYIIFWCGVSVEDLWLFFTSVFAIIGIALFAAWSLLSNVTAAFVLFYSSDIHIGDLVHYRDGDNSIKGKVIEMSLFYIRIKDESGHVASIPNNLAMQKVILKLES